MRTLRIIGTIGTVAAFLLSTGVAFAEEAAVNTGTSAVAPTVMPIIAPRPVPIREDAIKDARAEIQDVRAKAQAVIEAKRQEVKATADVKNAELRSLIEAKRQETTTTMAARNEEVKSLIEAKREEAKSVMAARKEELKSLIESKREETKATVEALREKATQRVAEIKDKEKQQTAERLTTRFENLNKTWTDRFVQMLDRYDAIVLKMQSRADTAAANGKDVTAVNAAIQTAQSAIAAAQAAVVAQAAKTYVLDTSTVPSASTAGTPSGQGELVSSLRTSFQNLHTMLFNDLFALRDGPMRAARQAVQDTLTALKAVPDVDTELTTNSNQ